MDRFPHATKTFMFALLLGTVACGGGDSKPKEENKGEFPASLSKVSTSDHTSVVDPRSAAQAQPSMREPAPVVAAPEPEVEPVKFSGFMHRGKSRFSSQDFSGAAADYEEAAQKRPESFRPRVQLARTYLALGKIASAREHAELAIEIDGASSLAWNTLGRVELAEHDHEAAVVSFERSVEENDDNSYAWNNLGFVLIEEEDYEGAVEALEAATSGAAPTSYMWNNLGMAYEHLDQIVLARASYRQASELGSGRAQDNFDRLEGVVSLVVTPSDEFVDASLSMPDSDDEEEAEGMVDSDEEL